MRPPVRRGRRDARATDLYRGDGRKIPEKPVHASRPCRYVRNLSLNAKSGGPEIQRVRVATSTWQTGALRVAHHCHAYAVPQRLQHQRISIPAGNTLEIDRVTNHHRI